MSEADPFREPARALLEQAQGSTFTDLLARFGRIAAEEAHDAICDKFRCDSAAAFRKKHIEAVASRITERLKKEKA